MLIMIVIVVRLFHSAEDVSVDLAPARPSGGRPQLRRRRQGGLPGQFDCPHKSGGHFWGCSYNKGGSKLRLSDFGKLPFPHFPQASPRRCSAISVSTTLLVSQLRPESLTPEITSRPCSRCQRQGEQGARQGQGIKGGKRTMFVPTIWK